MIKKLNPENSNKYIYAGAFDVSEEGKEISLNIIDEVIVFDLAEIINFSGKELYNKVDIFRLCQLSDIKATIYPSGSIRFSRLDSSDEELKSCYVGSIDNDKYILVIAFEETQPSLYKAELIAIFELEKSKS